MKNPTLSAGQPWAAAISPLPHLLRALRALYPPQCVVHVGIGQGMGELVAWRNWADLPHAVLIDADDTRLAWARHSQPSTWQVLHTTVAPSDGKHVYYRASNPQEDGLVPPEQLKPWWPQLTTLAADTRHTQTLDQIVPTGGKDNGKTTGTSINTTINTSIGTNNGTETSSAPSQPDTSKTPGHWLMLDCMPAANLLRGASVLLAHTSVVCARTSHAPSPSPTDPTAPIAPIADTGHQALVDLLTPLGFVLLGQTETHHPALGYTVMARQPLALQPQAAPIEAAHSLPPAPAAQLAPAGELAPAAEPAPSLPNEREAIATPPIAPLTGEQPAHTFFCPNTLKAENEALHHRLALLKEELLRAEGQINLIKDLMLRDQEL